MLGKLIKYDAINIYKLLVIFYILSVVFAALTRLFFTINNSLIVDIIARVCSGITISMIINIIINNLLRMWVRFRNNIYKDESYLTHTLPVSKEKIYTAKFLTLIITMFTSMVVIGVTLFIAYYSKENMEIIKIILFPVATAYGSTIINILLVVLIVFLIELITLLQAGFTGIIIGHKFNNNKLGKSVMFASIAYMVCQFIIVIGLFVMGLFNKDIMFIFTTNPVLSVDMVKKLLYIALGLYSICIVINYMVNIKLFKQGVNVE